MALYQFDTPKGVLEFDHEGDPSELTGVVDAWLKSQEPKPEPAPEPDRSFAGAIKQGIDAPLEAIGTTAEVLGLPSVGKAIKGLTDAPVNYESAGARVSDPQPGDVTVGGFGVGSIPRAITEQLGQVAGSIISRAVGALAGRAIGSAVGGTGGAPSGPGALLTAATGGAVGSRVGSFLGPFAFGAMQIAGPTAMERARNNGRTEPNKEDLAYALTTAASSGALDALGTRYLPGGDKAVGSWVGKITKAFAAEAPLETAQSLTEQTGASLGTKAGLKINPRQAAAEGLIGGGAAVSITAVTSRSDVVKQEAKETVAKVNETIADVAASEPPPLVPSAPQQPPEIVEQAPAQSPASPAPTPVPVPEGVEFIESEPNPNVSLPEGATSRGQVKFDETQSVAGITIYPDKIKLDRIYTPPDFRGQRGAPKIIQALKSKGKPIEVVAGEGRNYLEKEDLHAFYRKNGFRQMEGKPEGYFRWEPEQSETTETLTTKDGRKYRLAVEELPSYRGTGKPEQAVQVRALDESGNEIGYVTAKIEGDGAVITKMANVEKKWQRQGVYSELVNKLEAMGYTVTPDAAQSEDAKAFWANRRTRSNAEKFGLVKKMYVPSVERKLPKGVHVMEGQSTNGKPKFAFRLKDGSVIYGDKASAHFDLFGDLTEELADQIVDGGFVIDGKFRAGGDFSQGVKPGENAFEYYGTDRDQFRSATNPPSAAETTATQQTAPTESRRSTATPSTEVSPEVPQSADTEKLSAAQLNEQIEALQNRWFNTPKENQAERTRLWKEAEELERRYKQARGESMGPGAASPEEFFAMRTTGLKKAVVDAEGIARNIQKGMTPKEALNELYRRLPPEERQPEEARKNAAEDRIDKDATLAPSLVKRIVDDGDKAIDPDDAAVLLVERTRLMNERQQWEERVANGEDVEIGKVELQKIENQLNRLDQAQRLAGSTWGRVGHLYQRMMRADYSLEAMESRWRGAKQDTLSQEERAEVKELAETVKRTDEGLAQIETTRDQEAAEAQADEAIKQLKKDAAVTEGHDPLVASIAERIYQRLKKAAAAADERIKERRKYLKFSSTPIEYELIRDYAILAAEAIARGIRNFAKWRSEIHEKYGTDDDQYLETAWTEGNTMIDQAVERTAVPKEKKAKVKGAVKKLDPGQVRERAAVSMANKYETNQKIEELRPYVRKIALSFVRDGITEREPLVDAVHGMVTEVDPDVTRRQTMDMISGYGDFAPLDMETAKVQLRDIKGQLQQIAKLEDLQKTPPSVKKTGVERRKPSHKERQLIAKVNALMRENGVGTMESLKTRLRNRTVDLQTRMAEKDFAPRPVRKIDISKDPEAVKLKAENIRAKKEFERRKEMFERQNLEGWAKAWDKTKEALNTQRAIMTSFDFSGVLRQGGMVSTGIGNQKRVARAMRAMFEAAKSQQGFDRMQAELELRENAKNGNYDSSGLFLADQGNVRLSEREEAYLSSLSERIPGVGGSQRAYVAFLNRLRADMFDGMVETLTRGSLINKSGTASAKELKAIANYINIATGRGNLWKAEQAANTLATLFFSPRLMASRFQLLAMPFTGFRSGGGSMRTRALIAKEYGKTLSGLGLILALGAMMGATVGDDPNSSDFGKLIIGKTRVDFLFGLSQVTTLLSRLKTGKVTGPDGKETKESDSPIWKFLRNKFAPIPGALWDARDIMVKGKAPKGHPQTLPQLALRTITPMSFGNILSIMQDNGVPRGTALFLLNLFGAGVQVYDDKK